MFEEVEVTPAWIGAHSSKFDTCPNPVYFLGLLADNGIVVFENRAFLQPHHIQLLEISLDGILDLLNENRLSKGFILEMGMLMDLLKNGYLQALLDLSFTLIDFRMKEINPIYLFPKFSIKELLTVYHDYQILTLPATPLALYFNPHKFSEVSAKLEVSITGPKSKEEARKIVDEIRVEVLKVYKTIYNIGQIIGFKFRKYYASYNLAKVFKLPDLKTLGLQVKDMVNQITFEDICKIGFTTQELIEGGVPISCIIEVSLESFDDVEYAAEHIVSETLFPKEILISETQSLIKTIKKRILDDCVDEDTPNKRIRIEETFENPD